MLLRRITQHVKAQNWFAVGVDLVIVVIGVFIGIQVSNWNEARLELDRRQEVLTAILEDLTVDIYELGSGLELAALNIDAAKHALEQADVTGLDLLTMPIEDIPALSGFRFEIPTPPPFTEEQKRRLWSLSVVRFHPTQSNAAFGALRASGDLAIVDDPDLTRELQRYNQLWASLENFQNRSYRPFRDRAIFVGQQFGLSPFGDISEVDYVGLLRSNTELMSALRTLLEYGVIHKSQMDRVKEKAESLVTRLELELELMGKPFKGS